MIKIALAVVVLAGCSSLDDDVGMAVTATIAVQPSEPDSFAVVQLDLVMSAGSRADHELALDRVTLDETELAIAPFTPFWIHGGDSADRSLANAGTINSALAPLCGQTASLAVYITYVDGAQGDGTWASTPVAIACH